MGGVASEAAVGMASRPRLKRAAHTLAVVGADHAVAVFVGISGGWPVGIPEITTRADLQIFDYWSH